MTTPSEDDIKELAEVNDTMPTFISVYYDTQSVDSSTMLRKRVNTCEKALAGRKELLNAFRAGMERIWSEVEKPAHGKRSLVLFLSQPNRFYKRYDLDVEVKNALVLDTSPYVKELLQVMEDHEPYVVVVVDDKNARIFSSSMGAGLDHATVQSRVMNKHRMGGQSQMRFQRLRNEAVHKHMKSVVEKLGELVSESGAKRIVLAGPGIAKKELRGMLPEHLDRLVIAEVDMQADIPEGDVLATAAEVAMQREREDEVEAVARLRAAILKGELAAYGAAEVAEAVRQGRAELVLIHEGVTSAGWKCESCGEMDAGGLEKCPVCDGATVQVDLVEEIAEAAKLSGAALEFVSGETALDELGGVGALLRF